MKKLITMTEFVMLINEKRIGGNVMQNVSDAFMLGGEVVTYAQLLQTPLKLGQFIPCKDGEPMEKPELDNYDAGSQMSYDLKSEEYQKALELVMLFLHVPDKAMKKGSQSAWTDQIMAKMFATRCVDEIINLNKLGVGKGCKIATCKADIDFWAKVKQAIEADLIRSNNKRV